MSKTPLIAVLLFSSVPLLRAGTPVEVSGHWEGTIDAPTALLDLVVDLARDAGGQLAGTLTLPAQHLKKLPLSGIATEGTSVRFQLGYADGEHVFKGVLSADGTTVSGDYAQSGLTLPFTLTRKGEARLEAPPHSPRIGKELEGTWNGTMAPSGLPMRVVLKMSNQPDGTSTGTISNLDQSIEIPIGAIVQKGASLTLDVEAVSGSYAGTLNPEGTELAGTWTEGPLVLPLTLRRATAAEAGR